MNDQQTQNCQNAAELIVPAEAVTAEFATKPIGIAEVCDRLERASSILLLTHTRPDADTLGSAFALRELMRALGKTCEVINDDDIPKRLKFIFGVDSLLPDTLPDGFSPDLIVSVDISAAKLLGTIEPEYGARVDVAIDHHALGTPFAAETCMVPVGACGEIICDIAKEFKRRGHPVMNRAAASALYAAICSDTGSFKFDSVTPETHIRLADLLEYGINHAEIARRLYDSRPVSQVRATGIAICALKFYCGGKLALINFTKKMREDNGLSREDIDDIISLTRSIEGVEVGMSIKQSDDDETLYKVSMRSNRVADVSLLCAKFGGGGHKRASGCTLNADSPDEAEARLVAVVSDELERLMSEGAFDGADKV